MVLTYNVDSSYLADHGITVDLTHIMTGVFRLGPADVKQPRSLVIMRNAESRNSCHHLPVDSHDHLAVQMYPCHLYYIILVISSSDKSLREYHNIL